MQIFPVFPLPPTLSISTLIVVSVKPDKAPVALGCFAQPAAACKRQRGQWQPFPAWHT